MSLFTYDSPEGADNNPQQVTEQLTPLTEPPTVEEMVQDMTQEQRDAYVNITETCGVQIREDESELAEEQSDYMVIDPETGEEIDISEHMSLNEMGFIDAQNLRSYVQEAFYDTKLINQALALDDRYKELGLWHMRLEQHGAISAADGRAIDELIAGGLSSKMHMESMTVRPTKNKLSFVMEEVTGAQKAVAAGGVVVGLTIIYKLVQWFRNMWGNNGAAVSEMGSRVGSVSNAYTRMSSSKDIQSKALAAIEAAKKEFKTATRENMDVKEFNRYLASVDGKVTDSNAEQVLSKVVDGVVLKKMDSKLTLLWLSILTGSSTKNANGEVPKIDSSIFEALARVINSSKEIMTKLNNVVEQIETTGEDETIPDFTNDITGYISALDSAARTLGYSGEKTDPVAYANGFYNYIHTVWLGQLLSLDVNIKIDLKNVSVIDTEVFGLVDDVTLKESEKFYERLRKVNGGGFRNKDQVNTGRSKQRDSRVVAMRNISTSYRAVMNVFRAVLEIRNNLGSGLRIIDDVVGKVV